MKQPIFAAAVLAVCAPAMAQTSYWIANRASADIMRVSEWGSVLERVATPTTLRGLGTAPDGKVWILRFGATPIDIYDPATASFTSTTSPLGSPYSVAFDAAGTAWVTNGASAVHQFDANGNFLQTITLPFGSALGITIDGQGNKWVAHRVAPASVTQIDAAGVVTNFPIAGASASLLPIGVIADYRGIAQPSHIWVTGDSASQIAEIDGATGATLNVYTVPFASVAYPPTFDLAGRIWVSSFGNGNVVQLDQTNGTVLQTLTLLPSNGGIATDNFGRIRLSSRITFSGVGPPCEVRRIDPVTGTLEIPTLLTLGGFSATGTQVALSTAFQYALVVDQFGDLDGDGEANVIEVLGGTSPTDATSNGNFRIESFGATVNGGTPTFEVQASATTLWVTAFAGALTAPITVPGFGGTLLLDPAQVLLTTAGVGSASLAIAIPANPALAGIEFFAQGLTYNGLTFDFQNVTGLLIW